MNNHHQSRRGYWVSIIKGFDPEQSSVREYCQRKGVNEHSFYNWRSRLRNEAQAPAPVTFKLVDSSSCCGNHSREAGGEAAAAAVVIEIVLRNGAGTLHLPCEEKALRTVLAVLLELPRS